VRLNIEQNGWMASGTAARISMTAHRSDRRPTMMPDRFDSRKAGRFFRGPAKPGDPYGDGRGGSAARSPGPRVDPAPGSAIRQIGSESRLHKGYVPGVRENGGQYTHGAIWRRWRSPHWGTAGGVGAVGDDQPGDALEVSGGDRDLQGGTVRGRGRRLCAPAAHRARRMDLVTGSAVGCTG